MPIISDENFIEFKQDGSGYVPREVPPGMYEGVPSYADTMPIYTDKEIDEKLTALKETKTFPKDRYDEANPVHQAQGSMNFCWSFSVAQALEGTGIIAGNPYKQLAPESLGELVNWTNSGYYPTAAIKHVAEHGMSTRECVPQYSLDYKRYKPEWREVAKSFKVVEFYDLGKVDMWREMLSAGSEGFWICTGYNIYRHALACDSWEKINGVWCPSYRNTWQIKDRWTLTGSKKVANEAVAIRTVTVR